MARNCPYMFTLCFPLYISAPTQSSSQLLYSSPGLRKTTSYPTGCAHMHHKLEHTKAVSNKHNAELFFLTPLKVFLDVVVVVFKSRLGFKIIVLYAVDG